MLHTKFRRNRPAGSGEDFLKVFTNNGRGGHFGYVTKMPRTNFRSIYPMRLHIKLALIGQAVSEMFDHCQQRTDDGRTLEHGYTIISPMIVTSRTQLGSVT